MNPLKMLSRGGAVSEPSDADFENVTLLLHGDGTNGAQNNTFLDSSTNNFTITRNGNATQGTFSPFSKVDGRWGNYFDGSGDYIQVADNAALELASESNWTVEFWGYFVSTPSDFDVILGKGTASGNYEYFFEAFSDRTIDILYSANGTTTWTGQHQLTGDLGLNQWFHFAAVRNGATFKSYVNGVEYFSGSSFNIYAGNGVLNIGGFSGSSTQDPNMYLSNVRIVKGTAVYTSNFTPPTGPLTAITNTSLLTCQSNRFIDNSSNNFTITRNGDVRVTPFSPFPTLTAYSAATNGGSGYFDGAGDWLSAPSNAAFAVGSAFTIELWVYPISYGANPVFIFLGEGTGTLQFGLNSGNLGVAAAGVAWRLTGSAGPTLNAWNHCVLVRSGTGTNQTSIFLNGTRIANGTVTDAWTTNETAVIQSSLGNSYLTNGYMSSVRIVKGTAVYDPSQTTLTLPTAPVTAVSGTSLLLNCTNAGIIDHSMSNNLETVGNAQIDTTTKKYGTGSMEFDGNGDYLLFNPPETNLYQFGTGNMTIEFWFNVSAVPSNAAILSNRSSSDANALIIGLAGAGVYSTNGGIYIHSDTAQHINMNATVTTNTWHHVALVCNSSTLTLYYDGSSVGTASAYSINSTSKFRIGTDGTRGAASNYTGFIDDLRITKGKARYTSNFTPPTAALPDIGE